MKKFGLIVSLILVSSAISFSQEDSVSAFNSKYLNWYNLDLNDNGVLGASVNKTYQELLADRTVKKQVVVAVIDNGVDINNKDLLGKIWINKDEIPNNGIDDDNNGYIDDINGWNFIGNSKGENVSFENYEYTRVYKLGPDDKFYSKAKPLYEEEMMKRMKEKEMIVKFEKKYNNAKKVIKEKTGVEVSKADDLSKINSDDTSVQEALAFLKERYGYGFSEDALIKMKTRNADFLTKYLNIKFNPREIVGDNPEDINDNHYGNPDVSGPGASHGTCVAGIIAGKRNNGTGVDGIATDVSIMVLRVVPNGDERDKDVALAIRYAVDNGADIMNLSFGKAISPEQKYVDEAIRYAEQKNVLIVHAAGNDAKNVDKITSYPSDIYMDNSEATNFINVGASGMEKDDSLACFFSNYGRHHVDVFAPGENIVSLDTAMTYNLNSGTSMAAPVVTGIASIILSYYPDLKPRDIISILKESSLDLKKEKVLVPYLKNGKIGKVRFGTLSKSGGIVNLYNAVKKSENY